MKINKIRLEELKAKKAAEEAAKRAAEEKRKAEEAARKAAEEAARKEALRAVRAALKELKDENLDFNEAFGLVKEGSENIYEKEAVAAIAAQLNRLEQIQSYLYERFDWLSNQSIEKALTRNSGYNAIKASLTRIESKLVKTLEALWNAEHKKAKEMLDSIKASLDATKKIDYAAYKAYVAFINFDPANIKFADGVELDKLTRSKAAMSVLKSLVLANYGRDAWTVIEKSLPKLKAEKKNKGIEALIKKFNGSR